jgi:hypothetical protein
MHSGELIKLDWCETDTITKDPSRFKASVGIGKEHRGFIVGIGDAVSTL